MITIVIYLLIINIISLMLMYSDKQKAIKHEWRTPESTLWLSAVIGGSLGIWVGMKSFRHKTKHTSFKIGIPVLMILQVIAILYLLQMMS